MSDAFRNAIKEYYKTANLEDEVMELRAKLQAMTNDRDHWHRARDTAMEAAEILRKDRDYYKVRATELAKEGIQIAETRDKFRAVHEAEKARLETALTELRLLKEKSEFQRNLIRDYNLQISDLHEQVEHMQVELDLALELLNASKKEPHDQSLL